LTEHSDFREEKRKAFFERLQHEVDLEAARSLADEAFNDKDPELRTLLLAVGAVNHPLCVPHLPAGAEPAKLFNINAWAKSLAMARIVAANTQTHRVLIASAPKTGSTFLSGALVRTFDLSKVSLTLQSSKSYGHYTMGGALRDHDIDEVALLTSAMSPKGYVAHHHMICTPYLGKQAALYKIKAIITKRNVFDTFVSFDEHIRKLYPTTTENRFLRFGFPEDWFAMEFEDRMEFLLDLQLPWYARYYASWKLCEQQGDISPLWVSYETDILGDKSVLATRIIEKLGASEADIPRLTEELSQGGSKSEHFNKGVAGRGAAITGKNRQKIVDFFHRFRIVTDFADILDA
jgi:hypothetical protein